MSSASPCGHDSVYAHVRVGGQLYCCACEPHRAREAALLEAATVDFPFEYVGGGWFRFKAPKGEKSETVHGAEALERLRLAIALLAWK